MKAGRFRIGTLCTALLLMTWPPAAGVATPGDGVLAEVPFLRDRGGYASDSEHIVIDLGKPGGKPMPLILDTGASDSVMTPGAARRLGVSVRRAKTSP